MRCSRVDLAPQVLLFLVFEFGKLRGVVTQWMREGKRKLVLLLRFLSCRLLALLLSLLLWFQLGAHEGLIDLLFDGSAQLTWWIATEGTANKLK